MLVPHSGDEEKIKNAKYSNTKSIQGLGVDISSVYRFKGLENDVVIFLVPDENTLKATYIRNPLNLIYVGMTRAKFLLYVLGSTSIKNKVNWEKS